MHLFVCEFNPGPKVYLETPDIRTSQADVLCMPCVLALSGSSLDLQMYVMAVALFYMLYSTWLQTWFGYPWPAVWIGILAQDSALTTSACMSVN